MSIARKLVSESSCLIELLNKIEDYNKEQFKKTNRNLEAGEEIHYTSCHKGVGGWDRYSGPTGRDYVKFKDGSALYFGSPLGIRIEEEI